MANLTQVEKKVKEKLQKKVAEIKDLLPRRYMKPVLEKMEEQGVDKGKEMVYAVVKGNSYNKMICVIQIEVANEYQDKLKEAKKNAPKIKKRKLEEIEAEADAEIKRLGL